MSRAVTAPNRAREYETIYILRPDVDADGAERVGARVADAVSREKGRLTKVELWGRRRLAFEIAKHRRGVYVYLKYLGSGQVVSEVERHLRLSDVVLRYQTVLVGSDLVVDDLAVADDDVKFERVELTPLEDEREDSRERQLGLIEPERRYERMSSAADLDEGDEGAAETADEEEEG
jgi:small subunit ribosomal protein S6